MLCPECRRSNDDTSQFCRYCGSTLKTVNPGPLRSPETGPVRLAEGKTPIVAFLFHFFFPGLGQFYNGDFKKGILIFVLFWVGVGMAPATAGVSAILVWIWGAVNAYNVAARSTPLWT